MTREQWLLNLKEGTGIFDAATIKTLEPDPDLIAFAREVIRLPWVENPEDEFQRLETSALMYLAFAEATEAVHDVIEAILEAERIHQGWIPDISGELIRGFGKPGFEAAKAKVLELEQNTALLTDVNEETYWYYFYWGLLIGMNYVVEDNLELESEFVALTRQRLENPNFPDQLTDLWVGSVDDFKSSTDLEPLIEAFFANNPNTAKRGFAEWLETRKHSQAQKLPTSRALMQDFLLEVHEDCQDQVERKIKFEAAKTREAKKPVEKVRYVTPPHHDAPITLEVKVGRNDPCPCGSSKKFKQCHGKNGETRYIPENQD
jgi:SEC-C motif